MWDKYSLIINSSDTEAQVPNKKFMPSLVVKCNCEIKNYFTLFRRIYIFGINDKKYFYEICLFIISIKNIVRIYLLTFYSLKDIYNCWATDRCYIIRKIKNVKREVPTR